MPDDEPEYRPGAFVYALITARFLLELGLWSSFLVAGVRLVDGALGWITGVLLMVAAMALWGVLLSPRRPVRLPVVARVVVELALFVAAAALLAAAGLPTAAVVLLALELLVLGLLRGPDRHAL